MSAFSTTAFDTNAFSPNAFDFSSILSVFNPPVKFDLTVTPLVSFTLTITPLVSFTMSTTNLYIGKDYVAELNNITFDSVPADGTAIVTWELIDNCGMTIASGIGSYVSGSTPAKYRIVIDYLLFDSQRPVNVNSYKWGQLLVHISKNGANGSGGTAVKFMYPPLS